MHALSCLREVHMNSVFFTRNTKRGIFGLCFFVCLNAVAQTPSPALLVLDKEDNMLSIIDPANSKTVARIPTGEGPHEITASEDGKLAFVANYGARTPGNAISVMDLVAQKELRRVDLGALRRPHGITFADGKVWFTAEQNRLVARYDPAANEIDWLLGIGQNGTHMLVFSKDHSQLFTSNIGSDCITLLQRDSTSTGWGATNIAVGKGPEGGDISPDGRQPEGILILPDGSRAYVAVAGENTVAVLDLKALEVSARIPTGKGPDGMAWAIRR